MARSLIGGGNLSAKVNVYRFKQSLDDQNLLFWRPFEIQRELPFIFFLRLADGKLLPNTDFGASI